MSEPEKRVYAPRVFSFARRPDDRLQTSRGAPAAEPRVKTDTVYHVDRKVGGMTHSTDAVWVSGS